MEKKEQLQQLSTEAKLATALESDDEYKRLKKKSKDKVEKDAIMEKKEQLQQLTMEANPAEARMKAYNRDYAKLKAKIEKVSNQQSEKLDRKLQKIRDSYDDKIVKLEGEVASYKTALRSAREKLKI